jgi:radical SAM protein with 4Fe4S-binding SPASM domain
MVNDWPTFSSAMNLQLAKESFKWRRAFGMQNGHGDKVRQVSLRITDMCNLRCHTCGQWGDNGYLRDKSLKDLKQNEVPLEVYKGLVDQVVAAGWSPLWYIWGGEPMLYPGLIELLYYITERKMPIALVTNGTNVAKYAKEFVDTCKIFYLSVDGPTAAIHNQQRPGVSDKTNNFKEVEAVLQAVTAEKKGRGTLFPYVSPISVVASYNIHHLLDIYKFTSQYADAHSFYLSWWIDDEAAEQHSLEFERRFGFRPYTHLGWRGTWKDFDHNLILDQFNQMALLRKSGQTKSVPMLYPALNSIAEIKRYYEDHTAMFGFNQCVSIYMTMEVDSNGDVSLCRDYHDYIIGNIKTDSVVEMWNNQQAQQFRASVSEEGLMPACRRCCGLMGY